MSVNKHYKDLETISSLNAETAVSCDFANNGFDRSKCTRVLSVLDEKTIEAKVYASERPKYISVIAVLHALCFALISANVHHRLMIQFCRPS